MKVNVKNVCLLVQPYFCIIEEIMEQRYIDKIEALKKEGVFFEDTDLVYIDDEVQIGEGTKISPMVKIKGSTIIGKNCVIDSNSKIINSIIGDEVMIESSRIVDSEVGSNTTVGPYANIHTHTHIDSHCRIGNFVEIKNSSLGFNTKTAHLAYVGDTDIGFKCNVGCGVIFVNYNGETKQRSVIGNGVFIGSNSNVIAPVQVEDGAYIAAGSTVTKNLPANCMCIARARETIKENRSKYKKL